MSPNNYDPVVHSARDGHLLALARATVLPPLGDAFAAAVARYDDALFDRAERAGASQLPFLDGMRELRRRREEVAARFRAQLDLAWRSLEAGTPISAEAALASQSDGLSLVGEHELESRLAARNLAAVLLRDCKPVLLRPAHRQPCWTRCTSCCRKVVACAAVAVAVAASRPRHGPTSDR